ncbi:hypothetical protein M0E87_08700 [Corynebacterium sp. CCM 9185]|uniref:Uncharacterized protein n=1 Tax=Corynebacterium marambiense TaxID=2765364 RepID=A0ABS0VXZ0_9CORY|nr:hypothetical protein [Corynebacterium marambiense]MBI9001174.1 hypothetical protein [Corynebacterium marambiense]MCK7663735.1 hypothetical protein [Corynebacterium marambiense]MCX7542883.1 hypothetical protein [Corynebacterium marambiense]
MNDRTAEKSRHLIDNREIDDVLDQLGHRILNGAIVKVNDATDHLVEPLLNSPPDCRDARGSMEHIPQARARPVWRNYERSDRPWADQTTDADRLLTAFAGLRETGIVSGLFTNWKAMHIPAECAVRSSSGPTTGGI